MTDGREALLRVAEAARTMHSTLTRYDQVSGDGDFGDNFRDAFSQVERRLGERPDDEPFRVAAQVFLDEVGGSSGPLLGLLFQAIARAAQETDDLFESMRSALPEGIAAIQRVGEAEVGDRTMVDALVPASDAMQAGKTPVEVAQETRDAALATAAIQAKRGRSSYVGERAIGVPDPGAVGVALLLWAVARTVDPTSIDESPATFLDAVAPAGRRAAR